MSVSFLSLTMVFVFVCVMSVLLLHVVLRCFLEPSQTCFLTSIVCSESDRLLDNRHDRVGCQQEEARISSSDLLFSNTKWPLLHAGARMIWPFRQLEAPEQQPEGQQ